MQNMMIALGFTLVFALVHNTQGKAVNSKDVINQDSMPFAPFLQRKSKEKTDYDVKLTDDLPFAPYLSARANQGDSFPAYHGPGGWKRVLQDANPAYGWKREHPGYYGGPGSWKKSLEKKEHPGYGRPGSWKKSLEKEVTEFPITDFGGPGGWKKDGQPTLPEGSFWKKDLEEEKNNVEKTRGLWGRDDITNDMWKTVDEVVDLIENSKGSI